MGQWGPQHVRVWILEHYCDSNEVCAFVGSHSNNWTITQETEKRKRINRYNTVIKKPKHVANYCKKKRNLFTNKFVLTEW